MGVLMFYSNLHFSACEKVYLYISSRGSEVSLHNKIPIPPVTYLDSDSVSLLLTVTIIPDRVLRTLIHCGHARARSLQTFEIRRTPLC